jgi:hypothetical protein
VSECDTTEAAMEHIDAWGFQHIYHHLAERICLRVMQMLRFTKTPPVCDAIMFSFDNKVLGSNRPVAEIAREMHVNGGRHGPVRPASDDAGGAGRGRQRGCAGGRQAAFTAVP